MSSTVQLSALLEDHPFTVGEGGARLTLRLRRYLGERGEPDTGARANRPAVLMLHGGNTSSETFVLPRGGLARYLRRRGHDVWLLDWRASPHVVGAVLEQAEPLGGSRAAERAAYTLDRVVEEDLPHALAHLRRLIPSSEISLVGHCLGSGVVSLAIARGKVPAEIRHIVLSTLGLFYEVPWNGWIKAEDFILERVLHDTPECRAIDPKAPELWPRAFKAAYDVWPRAWMPREAPPGLLSRLTFMFGQPYATEALDPSFTPELLAGQFGPMHLGLYLHTGQMVRRGYAARFDSPDVIDRPRLLGRRSALHHVSSPARGGLAADDFDPDPFSGRALTLITAADNQLWHRDSMDLMYEWLRDSHCRSRPIRCVKRVFPGYRLQELLWGARAAEDVYPAYHAGVIGGLVT